MATGTLLPWIPQQWWSNGGVLLAGGTVETFIAGTNTHLATYQDVALTTPQANPFTLDGSGKPPGGQVFATPGQSYKIILKDSLGNTVSSQDNVAAIPSASANDDVTGTVGVGVTAGQVVYLSDGSGGLNAGQWYLADNANAYSSSTNWIGIAPNAISSGTAGTIRKGGYVTGLVGLSPGSRYYVGTAGALTSTAPAANVRLVGEADTATSLVLNPNPPLPTQLVSPVLVSPTILTSILSDKLLTGICEGRLTLTSGVAVTSSDVTAATTLYWTQYRGTDIALYDGSTYWTVMQFTETSIAIPATTSQMYDVFIFNNSGTPTLELLAWTNDTTRATALVAQNGILVKSGATTRRYLGSVRTTTVSGQTEDSRTARYLWNYYNRVPRALVRLETNNTWTYSTATIRQANGSTSNQVDMIVGVQESLVDLTLNIAAQATGAQQVAAGFGESSTTTFVQGQSVLTNSAANPGVPMNVRLVKYPSIGRTFYSWNEWSDTGFVTTWVARQASAATLAGTFAGIDGWIIG